VVLCFGEAAPADELETTDGRRLVGQVTRHTDGSVSIRIAYSGGGYAEVTVPGSQVKSIKPGPADRPEPAQARVPEAPVSQPAKLGPAKPPQAGTAPGASSARKRAEVEALIDKLGKTPPDWWNSVQLNYPKTLDLTRWEAPPKSQWNPNRTLGQYFWSVINENPSKWKEGCRFAHFLMSHFKDDRPNLRKAMLQAAHIYSTLLGDYARAAFWYRKAEAIGPLDYFQEIRLAECCWRLGSKDMAMEYLNQMDDYGDLTIKLLGEMRELTKALDWAKLLARDYPDEGYLAAGDACRFNGKYSEALEYYRQVQLVKPTDPKRTGPLDRNKKRAAASAEAIRLFETLDITKIPDGKYRSESIGYAGMIKVEVTVKAGRIESIRIVNHSEKQYYTALDDPRRQIIEKQSVKGIDMTTGATITAEAVVNATAKALALGTGK
jgi:uncharacterized protein with FMN-binding domain